MDEEIKDVPAFRASQEEDLTFNMKEIIKSIEEILKKGYLDPKHELHSALQTNAKGYIQLPLLLESTTFKQKLSVKGLKPIPKSQVLSMTFVISSSIRRMSRTLWSNPTSVRLLSPPVQKVSFVMFELVPPSERDQFESILAMHGSIRKIVYDEEEEVAIVQTNDPDLLKLADGTPWINAENEDYSIKVVDPEEVERSRQPFLEMTAFLKYEESQRGTLLNFMPLVWHQRMITTRESKTNIEREAKASQLVDFSKKEEKYESLSVQENGTLRAVLEREQQQYGDAISGQHSDRE